MLPLLKDSLGGPLATMQPCHGLVRLKLLLVLVGHVTWGLPLPSG